MPFPGGITGSLNILALVLLLLSIHYPDCSLTIAMAATDVFPNTLRGFGYGFNAEGQLRKLKLDSDEPGEEGFDFNVSDSQEQNQKHYEALGEVITKYVYELLEAEGQLQKLDVPVSDDSPRADGEMPVKSFIFASNDALTNPDRLLLLIHGSGVVRAGQWARSLIINDSLKTGTQLPYIHRARELGYGILVLNTNDNFREIDGQSYRIKFSGTPTEHANYVWEEYVRRAKAQHIAIVAHSYGGIVTMDLAQKYYKEFQKRVVAVAFTDSVHNIRMVSSKAVAAVQKVGRNWVASSQPLDTPIDTPAKDVPRVSAGTGAHERTSSWSREAVFAFAEARTAAAGREGSSAGEGSAAKAFGWNPSHLLRALLRR